MTNYYPPSVLIPVNCVLPAIGIVLLAIRIWVRLRYLSLQKRGLHADDYCSIVAVILTCACSALQLLTSIAGTNGNAVTSQTSQSAYFIELIVGDVQPFIEPLALGAIKITFLLFYRRIFHVVDSFMRASLISIGITILWSLSFFVAQMTICGDHIEYLWDLDQSVTQAHCGNKGALLLCFALTDIMTDLLVIFLPISCLRELQMESHKKWGMTSIFLLGGM